MKGEAIETTGWRRQEKRKQSKGEKEGKGLQGALPCGEGDKRGRLRLRDEKEEDDKEGQRRREKEIKTWEQGREIGRKMKTSK